MATKIVFTDGAEIVVADATDQLGALLRSEKGELHRFESVKGEVVWGNPQRIVRIEEVSEGYGPRVRVLGGRG